MGFLPLLAVYLASVFGWIREDLTVPLLILGNSTLLTLWWTVKKSEERVGRILAEVLAEREMSRTRTGRRLRTFEPEDEFDAELKAEVASEHWQAQNARAAQINALWKGNC